MKVKALIDQPSPSTITGKPSNIQLTVLIDGFD